MLSSVIQQSGQGPGVPGVPQLVAKADLTAQAANVGSTLLYTVPAGQGGMYRLSGYVVITQAATTSCTMPQLATAAWVDNDTGVAQGTVTFTTTSTSNLVGTNSCGAQGIGVLMLNLQAGSALNWKTAGYVSSGATPMLYAVHVKLEYLGA